MKTCKTGCGKMKAGGSIKKMAKGGQALNKAKGFAPAQKGGDNVKMDIFGISNKSGTTGPNRTGTYDYKKGGSIKKYQDGGATSKFGIKSYNFMDTEKGGRADVNSKQVEGAKYGEGNKRKYITLDADKGTMTKTKFNKNNESSTKVKNIGTKRVTNKISKIASQKIGGAIKKYQDGGPTIAESIKQDRREIMRTPSGKIGIIGSALGSAAIGAKMIADKIKSKKAEKKSTEEKKKKETTKAKFGASVNVQRGYPGKIRSAGDQGYTAVGNREPERTKFQKGGSTYLGGPSGGLTPGTIAMRADKEARSKYFTPDNIRKEGIKLSDKDIEKKVKVATDSLYKKYMKDAKLTPEKKSTTKKSGAKKMATGGSLKPVNKSANPGLAKLPTAVRNKMGYQKKGGSVKK